MSIHEPRGATSGSLAPGTVGVAHIVFLVLGAAAPMAAIVGAMTAAVAIGDGKGFTGAYARSPRPCCCCSRSDIPR